jgi:hypothetical protein
MNPNQSKRAENTTTNQHRHWLRPNQQGEYRETDSSHPSPMAVMSAVMPCIYTAYKIYVKIH